MHDHGHVHGGIAEIKRYCWITVITATTFALEMFGALASRSIALMSDVVHVAFDLSGHMIAIFVACYVHFHPEGQKNEDKIRARGGVISSVLLFVTVGIVFKSAVEKSLNPQTIESGEMFIFAVAGLIGNAFSLWLLEKGHEDHLTSANLGAHIRQDLLQSVGVVVTGAIIFGTGWHVLDIISTFLITIWLFKISVETFYESCKAALRHR